MCSFASVPLLTYTQTSRHESFGCFMPHRPENLPFGFMRSKQTLVGEGNMVFFNTAEDYS